MRIDGNKLTIELDEKTLEIFKNLLEINKLNPEKLFYNFINNVFSSCFEDWSNQYCANSLSAKYSTDELQSKLDDEIVKKRIKKWARDKKSYAYKMISVYLKCSFNCQIDVPRFYFMNEYLRSLKRDGVEHFDNFLQTFRSLCSDSARAYGKIFNLKKSGDKEIVCINEKYKQLIKESFICEKLAN